MFRICLNCGHIYDNDENNVCPSCEIECSSTAKKCDYCTEYIRGKYIEITDGRIYCEDCYTINELEPEY